jgi:hypothetical protein
MRCHRCNEPMTLFVIGEDYCKTCVIELAARARSDARRAEATARFSVGKSLDNRRPAA